MTDASPAARLDLVRAAIARAGGLAGRSADQITLIAVSKTHAAEAIIPLLEAGQRVFGENRVQEAEAKWPALRARFDGVELHLIGRLQSNKAVPTRTWVAPIVTAVSKSRDMPMLRPGRT